MRERSKLLLSIVDAIREVVGEGFRIVAEQDCVDYKVGVWCDLKNEEIKVYLDAGTIVPFRIVGSDNGQQNN